MDHYEVQAMAALLFVEGWTPYDKDDMAEEYSLSEDDATAICREIERLADRQVMRH